MAEVALSIGNGRSFVEKNGKLYLRTKTLPDICLAETKSEAEELKRHIDRISIHLND